MENDYTLWYEDNSEDEDLPDYPNFITRKPKDATSSKDIEVLAYHVTGEIGHYVPFDADKFLDRVNEPWFIVDTTENQFEEFKSGNFI